MNLEFIQNLRSSKSGYERQIGQVSDCDLKRLGTLDFDMAGGACFTSNEIMVLCFGDDESKQCRRGTNPTGAFDTIQNSTHNHWMVRISASKGKFIFKEK